MRILLSTENSQGGPIKSNILDKRKPRLCFSAGIHTWQVSFVTGLQFYFLETLCSAGLLFGCFGLFSSLVLKPVLMWTFLSKFTSKTLLHAPPLLLIGRINLSLLFQMEDSEEEEQEEEGSEEFNVIPPYSEKDSTIESGARGSTRGAASRVVPVLPLLLLLLLLPTLILDCWSYWSIPLIFSFQHTKWNTEDICEREKLSFSIF